MSRRAAAAALLLIPLLLAFAPAPLPRRGDDEISIRHLQGRWKLVRNERIRNGGRRIQLDGASDTFFVRIKGDLWTHAEQDGVDDPYSKLLAIQAGRGAVAIDCYHRRDVKREKPALMRGLIRRRGDTVEILGYPAEGKDYRPRSFEDAPANWWVMTLERMH
jgi:hypothetical protein